ncbi:hypothetical protein V2647_04690 [Tenacibaculum maritimum]|uniref:hypothetical protein n=1 Tax=Tenacibaculum maritimum TaxID=107401 RepID=UPI0038776757
MMNKIDLNTEKSILKELYNNGNNTFDTFPDLTTSLSDFDKIMLIEKHINEVYSDLIIEKILQRKVSQTLINSIYEKFTDNIFILNEIVMSGKASKEILIKLSSSKDKYLSEHSKLGLLIIRLRESDEKGFHEIYKEFESDSSQLNIAARYHIAAFRDTPEKILKILQKDTHKHVSEMATITLNNKTGK